MLKTSEVLYELIENLQVIYIKKQWSKVYGIELDFKNFYSNQVWIIPDFKKFIKIHKYKKYIILK